MCSENRWKPLHTAVYGLEVEDGFHTGRETSEARKTGSTVIEELSYCSLQTGGKRVQLCSSGSLAVAAETTEMPQEAERNWGRQQEFLLKSKLHQSCFLLSIPTPLPSSLYRPHQLPPPANALRGQQKISAPSNPTRRKTGLSLGWAPLAQSKPVASCCSSTYEFWEDL